MQRTIAGLPALLLVVAAAACNPFASGDDEWWPTREGRGGDLVATPGTLLKTGHCLYVSDVPGGRGGRLLVFPDDDDTKWDEDSQTLTTFGVDVRVGETIFTGGSLIEPEDVDEFPFVRKPDKECDVSQGLVMMVGVMPPESPRP